MFGRRWVFISIVAIFTLGSGICGGAVNGAMLIAGRAVQGVGSGGIVLTVSEFAPQPLKNESPAYLVSRYHRVGFNTAA